VPFCYRDSAEVPVAVPAKAEDHGDPARGLVVAGSVFGVEDDRAVLRKMMVARAMETNGGWRRRPTLKVSILLKVIVPPGPLG